jgi:putative chitinase
MVAITAGNFRALSQHAVPRIVSGIVANQHAIAAGGIDTPLRLCHFLAQLAHESAHFQVTREFASGEAYEGRKDLGNIRVGDGVRYVGRGLIQLTGRANYREATTAIRRLDATAPDFEAEPARLEDFPWALLSSITYWQSRKINSAADRDDITRVTELINGGRNGLKERAAYLATAKTIWMDGATHPTLRRSEKSDDVEFVQNLLTQAGFRVFADGDFGGNTEAAVKAFQATRGLAADGIVGQATWDALIRP